MRWQPSQRWRIFKAAGLWHIESPIWAVPCLIYPFPSFEAARAAFAAGAAGALLPANLFVVGGSA